jgi:hypothetical protein
MAQVSVEEAKQAAKSTIDFWETGRRSLVQLEELRRRHPGKLRYPWKGRTLAKQAKRAGLNADTLVKSQRAAQAFSKDHMALFVKLIRQHRAPFGATNLSLILQVPDGKRLGLVREAILHHWSTSELLTVIRQRFPRTRKGGRRPRLFQDVASNLAELERQSARWVRLVAAILPVFEKNAVPAELLQQLGRAQEAMNRVRKLVGHQLDKVRIPAE